MRPSLAISCAPNTVSRSAPLGASLSIGSYAPRATARLARFQSGPWTALGVKTCESQSVNSNESSIELRATVEADLPFVLRTETDPANFAYITPWSPEEHESSLGDPNIGHWVIQALRDQSPVGHMIAVGLTNENGILYLKRLVVACKAQGYGRLALRAFHPMAFRELSFTCTWLSVCHDNSRARALYESEGYVEFGLSPSGRHVRMALERESWLGGLQRCPSAK